MRKKITIFNKIILFLFILQIASCSPKICKPEFVSYYDEKFTNNNIDIIIYESRLELPNKFVEIGAIKGASVCSVDIIKKLASEHGADAVIHDSENFILIRFVNREKEVEDEADYI